LALVDRPADRSVDAALARAQTAIVLESVTNPDNVGGVFRNAAAFGADAVILSPECADPLYRKSIRTSMGAVLRVPFARTEQWPAAIDAIRGQGFAIVALTPREPSVPIDEWRTGQAGRVGQVGQVGKVALLVGAEGAGLSDEAASLADVRLRIPISDAVDSLNLAVAVGIALHGLRPCV
ncbi:MAG TPA: RNA methyltransferase, partial [Vicinamibacterales bacterium]|nr:RNA methyltransferase [Vicinamibacterales bacterium]